MIELKPGKTIDDLVKASEASEWLLITPVYLSSGRRPGPALLHRPCKARIIQEFRAGGT